MTTPNQTITLYDYTKTNNYIVWQHQTKQLHCVTTCKNMILWQEDTAKNNVSSARGGSCVWGENEKVVSGKSCATPWQTKITQVVTIKPNNYIVWQHPTTPPGTRRGGPLVGQTKQLHCVAKVSIFPKRCPHKLVFVDVKKNARDSLRRGPRTSLKLFF